jgi:hypothetical protein
LIASLVAAFFHAFNALALATLRGYSCQKASKSLESQWAYSAGTTSVSFPQCGQIIAATSRAIYKNSKSSFHASLSPALVDASMSSTTF